MKWIHSISNIFCEREYPFNYHCRSLGNPLLALHSPPHRPQICCFWRHGIWHIDSHRIINSSWLRQKSHNANIFKAIFWIPSIAITITICFWFIHNLFIFFVVIISDLAEWSFWKLVIALACIEDHYISNKWMKEKKN